MFVVDVVFAVVKVVIIVVIIVIPIIILIIIVIIIHMTHIVHIMHILILQEVVTTAAAVTAPEVPVVVVLRVDHAVRGPPVDIQESLRGDATRHAIPWGTRREEKKRKWGGKNEGKGRKDKGKKGEKEGGGRKTTSMITCDEETECGNRVKKMENVKTEHNKAIQREIEGQ